LRIDLVVLSTWDADFSTWDAVPEMSEPCRSTLDAPAALLLGADDPMLESPVIPDDGLVPVAPLGEAPPLAPPAAPPDWAKAAPLNIRAPITPAIAIAFIRTLPEKGTARVPQRSGPIWEPHARPPVPGARRFCASLLGRSAKTSD
jgi:hypothetical protein